MVAVEDVKRAMGGRPQRRLEYDFVSPSYILESLGCMRLSPKVWSPTYIGTYRINETFRGGTRKCNKGARFPAIAGHVTRTRQSSVNRAHPLSAQDDIFNLEVFTLDETAKAA